jgi:hypothetical protein
MLARRSSFSGVEKFFLSSRKSSLSSKIFLYHPTNPRYRRAKHDLSILGGDHQRVEWHRKLDTSQSRNFLRMVASTWQTRGGAAPRSERRFYPERDTAIHSTKKQTATIKSSLPGWTLCMPTGRFLPIRSQSNLLFHVVCTLAPTEFEFGETAVGNWKICIVQDLQANLRLQRLWHGEAQHSRENAS